MIDGLGVRASGDPLAYVTWQAGAQGAPMPLVFLAIRRGWPAIGANAELAKIAAGSLLGVVGYGVAIWAMSLSAMGQISALRETSIMFAAVIGVVFLKERFTPRRLIGAAMIAAGAVALSVS